jgi:cytosine permease
MSDDSQYATTKVEEKDFMPGWIIGLIIAGSGLALPVFYMGSQVMMNLGFEKGLMAIGLSTFALTALCTVTSIIGSRSRFTTYMILHFSFGDYGVKVINIIFGLTLIGWYSVGLELLAIAIQDTAASTFDLPISKWWIIVSTGVLTTITAIYGIKALERLANFVIPVLALFLCYVLYVTLQDISFSALFDIKPVKNELTFFRAVSVLIGTSIYVPVLMADFSRFLPNDKQSRIAVAIGVLIGTPVALVLGGVPSLHTGEIDFMKVMQQYNLIIPAFVLLFLSTWNINAVNLYSASLTGSTIVKNVGFKTMVGICSTLGVGLALIGFSNYLFEFLEYMVIVTPSISSIYIINFFWIRKQKYELDAIEKWEFKGIISWIISSIVSFLTYYEVFTLTGAYFVDSLLVGALIYTILNRKILLGAK